MGSINFTDVVKIDDFGVDKGTCQSIGVLSAVCNDTLNREYMTGAAYRNLKVWELLDQRECENPEQHEILP